MLRLGARWDSLPSPSRERRGRGKRRGRGGGGRGSRCCPRWDFFFFLFYPLGLRPLRPREAPGASSRGIFLRRSRPGIGPATCGAHPATFPLPTAKTSPNFYFFFSPHPLPPHSRPFPEPRPDPEGDTEAAGKDPWKEGKPFMRGKNPPKKSELSSPDSVPRQIPAPAPHKSRLLGGFRGEKEGFGNAEE